MFLIFIIYLNLYGYKTATYFDEKLFNIGAQLADNHSDLYDYCKSTNQSSCYQLMTGRKATFLEYFTLIHWNLRKMLEITSAKKEMQ